MTFMIFHEFHCLICSQCSGLKWTGSRGCESCKVFHQSHIIHIDRHRSHHMDSVPCLRPLDCLRIHEQGGSCGRGRQPLVLACLLHSAQQRSANPHRWKLLQMELFLGWTLRSRDSLIGGSWRWIVYCIAGVAIGAGRQTVVAYVNVGCYYAIGVPLGIVLGYVAHLRIQVNRGRRKRFWIAMFCSGSLGLRLGPITARMALGLGYMGPLNITSIHKESASLA